MALVPGHTHQSQAHSGLSQVDVSDSEAARTSSRCTITTLAGMVDVHVFSISLAEQGNSETKMTVSTVVSTHD